MLLKFDSSRVISVTESKILQESKEFQEAANLRILDLSRNEIKNVDKGAFSVLTELEVLHLDHNYIRELYNGTFHTLISLVTLYLQHNEIVTLPDNLFENNLKLLNVSLSNNKIIQISESLKKLSPILYFNCMDDVCSMYQAATAARNNVIFIVNTTNEAIFELEKKIKDLQMNCKPGQKIIIISVIGVCIFVNIIIIIKLFL